MRTLQRDIFSPQWQVFGHLVNQQIALRDKLPLSPDNVKSDRRVFLLFVVHGLF